MKFVLYGIMSVFFTLVALRKNRVLPVCFFCVAVACFLLAAGQWNLTCQKAGGAAIGIAGLLAWYLMAAEIVNEELQYACLPGLESAWFSLHTQQKKPTFRYDPKANTIYVNFGTLALMTEEDVAPFFDDVFLPEIVKPGKKVHAVIDYGKAQIGSAAVKAWKYRAREVESKYYLSVRRNAMAHSFGGSQAQTEGINLHDFDKFSDGQALKTE